MILLRDGSGITQQCVWYFLESVKANKNVSEWNILMCSGRQTSVWNASYWEWFETRTWFV